MGYRKGMSALIATILILLIVIAMVGFSFGFFQRLYSSSTTATETEIRTTTGGIQQRVGIEAVSGTTLTVRGIGSASVPVAGIGVYVNGAAVQCNWGGTTSIAPGQIVPCTLPQACGTGQAVRVTAPGGENSAICS